MSEPTLERICLALGLEEYEQDWGIIHSDHRKLEEFLSYARSGLPEEECPSARLLREHPW